ncbi:unnamed protein product [Eruca vesicaria subsp. sativa]|uniref:Uncharacterized protein n=1 Tax=Eruca vesicaria subsp. sativa TaxID=29727 RepID=A0ABC8L461_ERUVS|nr:unnamed protein product [Eruca vesicaria subsp. sativa]
MGCSNSKLGSYDDPVKICKDRKRFIQQTVEHMTNFASAHTAYIKSLRNVSNALREFLQEDVEPHEFKTSYLISRGTRPLQVQETPPEIYKVESYEADGFLEMNIHMNPPNSPQSSQWNDFFWNPLTSYEYNGYNYYNESAMEDEMRRIREEEGIPDLEEDDGHDHHNMKASEDCNGIKMNQEDEIEHVNEEKERGIEVTTDDGHDHHNMKASEDCNGIKMNQEDEIEHVNEEKERSIEVTADDAKREETNVCLNRKPTSMGEVIKDLEDQFTTICNSANEVSGLLEANKVECTTSSRLLMSSESSSVISEESRVLPGHQATLDRLYLWETKLYDEVKSGERVRIAYEKKCLALRKHDLKGDESSSIDKTRVMARDLDIKFKVYIHSIESISARIETLRDQELLPQILELLQGLTRMWKVMAECHQIQKRTLDEAKLLLSSTLPHLKKINIERLAGSALKLVTQLQRWRACFQAWITSQRSYVCSLTGWLLKCIRGDTDPEKVKLPTSPYQLFEVCIGWSRLLNGLNEKHVVEKLDFFNSCMGSIFTTEGMELDEVAKLEKMAEIAVKVVCNGMSVAVSSLAEFAITSADEHLKLVNHTSEQQVKVDNVE